VSAPAVAITPSHGSRAGAGRPLPLRYSLLLAVPLVAATLYGLLAEDAYRTPADIAAQGRGQDLLTLASVPVLVWAATRARSGSLRAHLVWLGLMLYYVYSYLMYALATPYNDAFVAYLAVLGLSGFGLLNGLCRVDAYAAWPAFGWLPRRRLAGYLLVVGVGLQLPLLDPLGFVGLLASYGCLLAFAAAYPQHSAADNALYLAGLVREVRGDCGGALQLFEAVPVKYPAGDAVPQAQLERGRCLRILGRKGEAKSVLNQLSEEHPQAPESAHSRQLLQGL